MKFRMLRSSRRKTDSYDFSASPQTPQTIQTCLKNRFLGFWAWRVGWGHASSGTAGTVCFIVFCIVLGHWNPLTQVFVLTPPSRRLSASQNRRFCMFRVTTTSSYCPGGTKRRMTPPHPSGQKANKPIFDTCLEGLGSLGGSAKIIRVGLCEVWIIWPRGKPGKPQQPFSSF